MITRDYRAPGEDVDTVSWPDAQHWSDFYRQRASFDETLRLMQGAGAQLSGEPRREACRQAMPILIADAEQFRVRFDFWEARLAQLSLG
jgi:hypothetical protein